MASFVQSWFANKLVEDDREPLFTVRIPRVDGEFGVLAPKIEFWLQLGQLLLIQTLISCVFSIFIYKYIVQQRRTWSAYLFGYGLVIPLACWFPFRLLEFSQVENLVLKMSFSTMPTIVVFKCLEAMYDTSLNTAVEASLQNYTIYYASLVNQVWDTKTNQRLHVTSTEFCSNLKTIFFQYMIVSVVRSYLSACQFQPFASNIDIHEYSISFQPGSLVNNYCMALLTFYTLCVAFNLTGFVTGNLMGYAVKDVLYNPLVSTRSPRDFWRAQWNPVIGGALKRAAFLPVRQYFSARVAIVATFFMSGLLHDYTWACIFYQHHHKYNDKGECVDCFLPLVWKQSAFFVYCGMVVMVQPLFSEIALVEWCCKHVPLPIVSTLVILTVLPCGHWYFGDWIAGGFFHDFALGLVCIVRLD